MKHHELHACLGGVSLRSHRLQELPQLKSTVKAVMVQGTRTGSDQRVWQPSTGKEITLANIPSLEIVLQGALLLIWELSHIRVALKTPLGLLVVRDRILHLNPTLYPFPCSEARLYLQIFKTDCSLIWMPFLDSLHECSSTQLCDLCQNHNEVYETSLGKFFRKAYLLAWPSPNE